MLSWLIGFGTTRDCKRSMLGQRHALGFRGPARPLDRGRVEGFALSEGSPHVPTSGFERQEVSDKAWHD